MIPPFKADSVKGGRNGKADGVDARKRARTVGLYVHVPFCEKICHYCAFNTFLLREGGVEEYLDALEAELRLYMDGGELEDVAFDTVFIGGGTPTALTAEQLTRLLELLFRHALVTDGAEITIEANPGTLIDRRLEALRAGGVNRLSLGVQSLNDALLHALGRIHTASQAYDSYARARRVGFDNVSLDLMFGLPGQNAEDWRRTLTRAASWGPDHLSCYGLIIEEGTPFARRHAAGRLPLPDEDEELAMYRFTMAHLAEQGYEHYEISNWARPGRQSRHNRIYWEQGQWLGLGPGAYSQWRGRRFANVLGLDEYVAALKAGRLPVDPDSIHNVSRAVAMEDALIFGLRLREGVAPRRFFDAFGVQLEDVFGEEIGWLVEGGLLEWSHSGVAAQRTDDDSNERRLRLTEEGLVLSNQVLQRFIR